MALFTWSVASFIYLAKDPASLIWCFLSDMQECQSSFNSSQAKKCLQCSFALLTIEGKFTGRFLPVDNAGVHEECLVAWKVAHSDKCFFCREPACEIPGRFSGNLYEIPGKGKLHEECHAGWKKAK